MVNLSDRPNKRSSHREYGVGLYILHVKPVMLVPIAQTMEYCLEQQVILSVFYRIMRLHSQWMFLIIYAYWNEMKWIGL